VDSPGIPPLRERKVDLARLVQREVAALGRTLVPHAKLIEACWLRPWPGNLRELRAAVRRAATTARMAGRDVVRIDDLGATDGMPAGTPTSETAVERPLPPAEFGRDEVTDALARANGVVSVAARLLGVHRTQLHRLMVKYGLARDDG
jgi:transcriptional regulator with GAF, ATPase, and Fis domain